MILLDEESDVQVKHNQFGSPEAKKYNRKNSLTEVTIKGLGHTVDGRKLAKTWTLFFETSFA